MKTITTGIIVFSGCLGLGWWSAGYVAKPETRPATGAPVAAAKAARTSRVPDEIRTRVKPLRETKSRAAKLREVVLLATNLPVADFERWYEGNYLEFLDGQLENVFYAIINERWREADPAGCAQFMIKRGDQNLVPYIAAWLQADEAAVLEFARSRPLKKNDAVVRALVKATADQDGGKALALVKEFDDRVALQDTLGQISLKDREGALALAQGWDGERKLAALNSMAAAWAGKDMPWLVAALEREGSGLKVLSDLVNHVNSPGDSGRAILKNFEAIPAEWWERLATSPSVTLGAELEWLNEKSGSSKVPADLLAKIQGQASSSWWYGERRSKGQELVSGGDWLSMETRSEIAAKVVEDWKENPEAARAWATSLEEPLRTAALGGFEGIEKESTRVGADELRKTPAGLMEVLQGELKGISFHGTGARWDDADMAQAADLASRMDPAKATSVVSASGMSFDQLPREVGGALLIRAMAGGELNRECQRQLCTMAARWAQDEPRWAASWVERLPEGENRIWAAKNVAIQWSRYSPEEVRAWAGKLGAAEKAAVMELLK